jgi:hypothetical protein
VKEILQRYPADIFVIYLEIHLIFMTGPGGRQCFANYSSVLSGAPIWPNTPPLEQAAEKYPVLTRVLDLTYLCVI